MFVENVHEFMQAADLVVTKAGPGTVAEALACGASVCISGHLPWTEIGNTEYYTGIGAATCVRSPAELVGNLRHILDSDHRARKPVINGGQAAPSVDTLQAMTKEFTAILQLAG